MPTRSHTIDAWSAIGLLAIGMAIGWLCRAVLPVFLEGVR